MLNIVAIDDLEVVVGLSVLAHKERGNYVHKDHETLLVRFIKKLYLDWKHVE
jgi:hypothetical protein